MSLIKILLDRDCVKSLKKELSICTTDKEKWKAEKAIVCSCKIKNKTYYGIYSISQPRTMLYDGKLVSEDDIIEDIRLNKKTYMTAEYAKGNCFIPGCKVIKVPNSDKNKSNKYYLRSQRNEK